MEKLNDMFIKGQYTPFSDQPSNKKHPLSDSTNGKPAKKRKIQLTTSDHGRIQGGGPGGGGYSPPFLLPSTCCKELNMTIYVSIFHSKL